MRAKPRQNQRLLSNLMWFIGSLFVALLVWFIASTQLDPVEEWRLPEPVPIRVTPEPGLLITNEDRLTRTARLLVRARSSVRQLIAADDIIVTADLTGLGAGEHVVELDWQIVQERQAIIVDITPRQITVNLEGALSILVPVRVVFSGDLPRGYTILETPAVDTQQVMVSGAASRVEQVAEVQVEVDLDGQRDPIEDDVRPVPVDADGIVVSGVTVDTQIIRVNVNIGIQPTPTPLP